MPILEVHFVIKKFDKKKSDEWIKNHHLKPLKITSNKVYRKYVIDKSKTYKKKKAVWNFKKDVKIIYGESDFLKSYIEKHMPSVYQIGDEYDDAFLRTEDKKIQTEEKKMDEND